MGRFENNQSSQGDDGDVSSDVSNAQKKMIEELQTLQQNVLKSLQDDINHLQTEKNRLAEDVQKLQVQKTNLQQEQLANEHQVLLRQLVQVLANHVSLQLQSSLEKLFADVVFRTSANSPNLPANQSGINTSEASLQQTERLLNSFNGTVLSTFEQLQGELRNYQSNFSQQLSRMYSEQEQGEALLAELVHRLRYELENSPAVNSTTSIESVYQVESEIEPQINLEEIFEVESNISPQEAVREDVGESSSIVVTNSPNTEATEEENPFVEKNNSPYRFPDTVIPNPLTRAQLDAELEPNEEHNFGVNPPQTSTTKARQAENRRFSAGDASRFSAGDASRSQSKTKNSSWFTSGLVMVVLSLVASALYNVSVRAMFFPRSQIFGVFDVQQLISPTLGNCLLILMLRMLVVVPLMLVLAPIMHPSIWQDISALANSLRRNSRQRNTQQTNSTPNITKALLILAVASGFFLFLSQLLIYLAIGQVATGIAIALFFIYPIVSGFLAWLLFKSEQRQLPTLFGISAIACICLGELLVISSGGNGNTSAGATAAILSGISFAIYIILTRICAAKIHPVTFTLLNFTTMLVFCFIGLIIPLPSNLGVQINNTNLLELVLTAFILGVLTLSGYILNNLGVRKFGANRSAIIGATLPAVTVIFAGLIIQESLAFIQVIGVLIVTLGAAAFNLEKIRDRLKTQRNN
jgi:drug/metabolite transporter (DMT)-like permease